MYQEIHIVLPEQTAHMLEYQFSIENILIPVLETFAEIQI